MPVSFDCLKCGYHEGFPAAFDCDQEDIQCDDCGEWGCDQCIEDGKCEDCRDAQGEELDEHLAE